MFKSQILRVMLFACNLAAGMEPEVVSDDKNAFRSYRVPSCSATEYPVTAAHLAEIMPTSACIPEGRITALVVRTLPEWHRKVRELMITGDEVSLMRTDVSDALGGAHMTGDAIHVDGIDLSESTFPDGAVMIIKKRNESEPSAVLLKTFMPHLADWKFKNRCGQRAYDFMNDEGQYAAGGTAVRERLRGVLLAVLKEGTVTVGDCAEILGRDEGEELLNRLQLHARAESLITSSLPIAQKMLAQFEQGKIDHAITRERMKQRLWGSLAGIASISGIAAVFILIYMGGSF